MPYLYKMFSIWLLVGLLPACNDGPERRCDDDIRGFGNQRGFECEFNWYQTEGENDLGQDVTSWWRRADVFYETASGSAGIPLLVVACSEGQSKARFRFFSSDEIPLEPFTVGGVEIGLEFGGAFPAETIRAGQSNSWIYPPIDDEQRIAEQVNRSAEVRLEFVPNGMDADLAVFDLEGWAEVTEGQRDKCGLPDPRIR